MGNGNLRSSENRFSTAASSANGFSIVAFVIAGHGIFLFMVPPIPLMLGALAAIPACIAFLQGEKLAGRAWLAVVISFCWGVFGTMLMFVWGMSRL